MPTAETEAHAHAEGRQLPRSPIVVAGEKGPHHDIPAKMVIENATKPFTDPGCPRRRQQSDLYFIKIRSNLLRDEIEEDDRNQRVRDGYLLHDKDLLWFSSLGEVSVLAVHQILVRNLICPGQLSRVAGDNREQATELPHFLERRSSSGTSSEWIL